jgi:hypothetical protein
MMSTCGGVRIRVFAEKSKVGHNGWREREREGGGVLDMALWEREVLEIITYTNCTHYL